jgi:hypothetical protein
MGTVRLTSDRHGSRLLTRCGKTPRSPFDKLRANGSGVKIAGDFPFVLSLSKHGPAFFSSLLNPSMATAPLSAARRSGNMPLLAPERSWGKIGLDCALVVGKPGRIVGWMGRCGNRIEFDGEARLGACRECRRTYWKMGQGVSLT